MRREIIEFYESRGLNVNEDKYLLGYLLAQSEDALTRALIVTETETRKLCPDARLVKVADKDGNITRIGVYNLPLILNHRHNFQSQMQHSPQLISVELIDYKETHLTTALTLALQLTAWISAYRHLLALAAIK